MQIPNLGVNKWFGVTAGVTTLRATPRTVFGTRGTGPGSKQRIGTLPRNARDVRSAERPASMSLIDFYHFMHRTHGPVYIAVSFSCPSINPPGSLKKMHPPRQSS